MNTNLSFFFDQRITANNLAITLWPKVIKKLAVMAPLGIHIIFVNILGEGWRVDLTIFGGAEDGSTLQGTCPAIRARSYGGCLG